MSKNTKNKSDKLNKANESSKEVEKVEVNEANEVGSESAEQAQVPETVKYEYNGKNASRSNQLLISLLNAGHMTGLRNGVTQQRYQAELARLALAIASGNAPDKLVALCAAFDSVSAGNASQFRQVLDKVTYGGKPYFTNSASSPAAVGIDLSALGLGS